MLFNDLKLIPPILSALQDQGYATPTPVQAAAIPPILEGRDLLGCAQTGTGKTAAFALPILQLLNSRPGNPNRDIRALILTPTRELAAQIAENFTDYGKNLPLKHCVIFGGVGESPQKAQLRRGVDILIATPGRLIDLLGQRALSLSHLEIFTLDEADRMLDMGFVHDVRRICALVPKQRQTLLFSATMPNEIRKLADGLLRNPVRVEVAPVSSTADRIDQGVFHVGSDNKSALLRHVLSGETVKRALVFTRTKHGADRLKRALDSHSIPSEAIHGNKSQGARQRSLANFKDGTTRVLVATDLAARGLDVDDVTHVVNYDLPAEPETYVHRIGRTARAGNSGIALSLCGPDDRDMLAGIERLIRKRIPVVPMPSPEILKILIAAQPLPSASTAETRPQRPDNGYGRQNGARQGGRPHHQNHSGNSRNSSGQQGRQENRSRAPVQISHESQAAGISHAAGPYASRPARPEGQNPGRPQGQGHQNQGRNSGQPSDRQPAQQGGKHKRHGGQGEPFVREYFSNER